MQRQNPESLPEATNRSLEENSQAFQQPDTQSLMRHNRRSSLRDKIIRGYALALGIAVLGTTAGLSIGNYQYQQSQQQAIDIDEETRLFGDFHQKLAQTKIQISQIMELKLNPEKLKQQSASLLEQLANLKLLWAKIQSEVTTTELEDMKLFLQTQGPPIEAYLQRSEILAEQLHQSVDVKIAQQLVLEFLREDMSLDLLAALEAMEKIEDIGDKLEDTTRENLEKAERLRIQIIVFSMIFSSAIAIVLALKISRAIAHPIQILTAIAHQVTQEANFDIQATVMTTDEVGILATSLNQLIQQVKFLLKEQKAAGERQLLQNEKLASLGRMLAEVAHELNNPLSSIYGNLDFANNYFENLVELLQIYQSEIPQPPIAVVERAEEIEVDFIKEDLPQVLQAMKIAAERAKGIIQSLKNFSRLDESTPHSVNLHACLDSTLLILNNRLKHIAIVRNYGELPAIEGYEGMLSQVFMNVLSNAIEAFEDRGSLRTEAQSPCIEIATECLNKEWVAVRIIDNGPGIQPENKTKIFESFFTTKPRGIGTGLGLTICHQIVVEKHGGRITGSSEVGRGTEFAIALPIKRAATTVSRDLSSGSDEGSL